MINISIPVKRFLAFYLDLFFITFFVLFLYFIVSTLHIKIPYLEHGYIYIYIIFFSYLFICELIFKKTLGKKVFQLEIEFLADGKIIFFVFIRTISRLIPFEPLSIFFNPYNEMWHDRLSKTKVVSSKAKVSKH